MEMDLTSDILSSSVVTDYWRNVQGVKQFLLHLLRFEHSR